MNNKEVMQVVVLPANPFTDAGQIKPVTATGNTTGDVAAGAAVFGSIPSTSPVQAARIRAVDDNADGVSPIIDVATQFGLLGTMARNTLYDPVGDSWNRARAVSVSGSSIPGSGAVNVQLVAAAGMLEQDGSGLLVSQRGAVPDRMTGYVDGSFGLVALPAQWGANNAPAAATAAVATRAAEAGTRHICRTVTCTLLAVAAQAVPVEFVVRDGATGVGAILWRSGLMSPAGDSRVIVVDGLSLFGSVNTAMTIETLTAPAATNFVRVAMTGTTAEPV